MCYTYVYTYNMLIYVNPIICMYRISTYVHPITEHTYHCMRYSEFHSFSKIWWINEFGELTGYTLVLVHYIGTGKL